MKPTFSNLSFSGRMKSGQKMISCALSILFIFAFILATMTIASAKSVLNEPSFVSDNIGENFAISITSDRQMYPELIWNATANEYLVVWDSDSGGAVSSWDIYGQRLSGSGSLIGEDFTVSVASGAQYFPEGAWNATANEYLVVWHDFRNGRADIYGQRISASGSSLGGDFAISSALDDQFSPNLVWNATANEYLVVWHDLRNGAADIYGQRISGSGSLLGDNFAISTALGSQSNPAVAWNATINEYLVAWSDTRNGSSSPAIYGQRVSDSGSLQGEEFSITTWTGYQGNPSIAWNVTTNEYLIVWNNYQDERFRPDHTDITAQRVSDSGSLLGENLVISTMQTMQSYSAVAYNTLFNEYLVVWEDSHEGVESIFGQRVSGDGLLLGGNFTISTPSFGQYEPALAWNTAANEYLVVWEDFRNSGDMLDIYGQRVVGHIPDLTPDPTPTPIPTVSPVIPPHGLNLAAESNGGAVRQWWSNYGYDWDISYLIDGRSDWGWSTSASEPRDILTVVELSYGETYLIDTVRINPSATHGHSSSNNLRNFEIWVSTSDTGNLETFTKVFAGTIPQENAFFEYTFPPVPARQVMLYCNDNYGGSQIDVAEFEVYLGSTSTNTISGNAGIGGATIAYTGGSTMSDAVTGNYSFLVLPGWTGTITPSKIGYTFAPASIDVTTPVDADLSDQNFTALPTFHTISGNAGIGGATIAYIGGSTTSDAITGAYSFTVPHGWSGTVTPLKNGYAFSPANRIYNNVQASQVEEDYSATNTTVLKVTINQSGNQSDATTLSPINFIAVFNEPINRSTFTNDDITLGGTAGATTAVVSEISINNGTTFNIAVSGMSNSGTVTASLGANKVTDLAGNPNTASTSSDNTVTYNLEFDTACGNVPIITSGQNRLGNLVAPDDIDPYKFDVTQPYSTIVATLTPPTSGDFVIYLYDSCQDGPVETVWGNIGRRWLNIGRRWLNIGPGGDPKIEMHFNVGKEIGTYYLAVAVPEDGAHNASPYTLHLELQPPDFGLVDTLILYNPSRFKQKYGLDAASQMMDTLTRLASHPKVNGIIIQLDQFPDVVTAYNNWDHIEVSNGNEHSYTTNVAAANAVSNEIRGAMLEFMQNTGNLVTGYVVVVGDDNQIPFRRLDINPDSIIGDLNWMSERNYFLELGDTPDTPLDAALMADQVLSDDFYGNYRSSAGMGFLPGLAIGRLLDTPARIQNTIDAFIRNNGEITLTPGSIAAIAGYDFLTDGAQQACTSLHSNGGVTTDCALIDTPAVPNIFTSNDVLQKFIVNAPTIAGFYGHTNHGQMFTPNGSVLTADQISVASFDPASSLWWVIGCQSGLVMPDSENHPLSLAQSLGDHGVTYLGNTGWAWGSDGPLTYSELLYQMVTKRLRTNSSSSVAIGEALRLAKRDYFYQAINNGNGKGKNYTFSDYDYKVMSEATLYGLPMLKFNFPYTASAPNKPMRQNFVAKEVVISQAMPSQFHPFPFSLGNLTNSVQQYNGNTYYTNAGKYAFSANVPLLPQSEFFNFNTSLGDAKGVIWTGGHYTTLAGNNPLVIKPIQLNATSGNESPFNGTYPLLPVALADLEELDGTFTNHLTFQTGQYSGTETNGTLRLFSDMEFLVGLWNGTSGDDVHPELGIVSMASNGNTVHIELPVTDDSGVYKAFVTYTNVNPQAISGSWQSVELMAAGVGECTAGQHTYSLVNDLVLTDEINYFIQVMDCSGNVSVQTNNGQYYKVSSDTPFVSTIVRTDSNPTNATSVNFTITFSEPVTGVDTNDFTLTTTGVSGAVITGISGTNANYTVTVNTGTGNGTIRLNVVDDDSIKSAVINPLGGTGTGNGDYLSGESYTIDKTAPVISEGDSISVTMSEDGSPTLFSLTLNAIDTDNPTLTWSIGTPASHGTASASGTGTSKSISYAPAANYNGSDSFVVRVSDGSLTDTITVNVTISPDNDSPIITEGTSKTVTMSEDGSPTPFNLTLNVTDVDSATFTWNISTPASYGTATASGTGLSKAINYTPTANYNSSDSFVVQVSDGGLTDTITINVNVDAINDAPSFTKGANLTVNEDSGSYSTVWVTNIFAGSANESTQTIDFIVTNNNNPLFSSQPAISPHGVLTFALAPNTNGSAIVTVRIHDNGGTANGGVDTSPPQTFTITVTPVNDPPVITEGASISVTMDEDGAPNVFGLTLHATNPDTGETLSWNINTPASHGTASVSGTGTTKIIGYSPNSNYNGPDSFIVQISDGALTDTITVNVTINPVNDPPADIGLSANSVIENQPSGTLVGNLSTTDIEAGDTHTYTFCGGTDDASFRFSGNQLQTNAAFNYEVKNSYSICIRSTDSGNLYTDKTFAITVTNANETPTNIALSNSSVAENLAAGSLVGNLTTTDPDAGGTFTYTFCGGTDDASFRFSGNQLQTNAAFNYEVKNSYSICIRSTDSGNLYTDKTFTITVTNANETPTNIALSNSSVAENLAVGALVGNLSTTDPDAGDTFAYSFCGGTDDASFRFSGNQLQTNAAFNYEVKNSFSVCVRSTDSGSLHFDKTFSITVTNANGAPTNIALSNSSVAENLAVGALVGNLSTTDPDAGDTFAYSFCGGTDDASFRFSGNQLQTNAVFNYEVKTSYSVCVRSTDSGSLRFDKTFSITVTDANDAPTNIALTNNIVKENLPIGTTVGNLTTTDADAGNTHTYALACVVPGADDASFQISGSALQTKTVLDYESKASHSICIRVNDGHGGTFDKNFTVNVSDVPGLELLTPATGTNVHTNRPTFDWVNYPGAIGYNIQISKNIGFTSLAGNITLTGATNSIYTPATNLTANVDMWWRVRAKLTSTTYSGWSEVRAFHTGNPPSIPTLRAPANNALVTITSPLFDWANSTVPAGVTFDHYQIQVSTSNVFGTTMFDHNVAGITSSSENTAVLAPATTYYWRVRSWSAAGDFSGWSAVRSVRIAYAKPTLIAPSGVVATLKPTFTWNLVPGATSYNFQVSKNTTFTLLVISKTVYAATYTHTTNLVAGTTYYWRVRVNGAYGPSAWSDYFTFTTP